MSGRRHLGSFDVAIVGSGFAGSILGRCLALRGMRVALIERGRHPRFALGESSTPLAALSLERLARDFGCPDLHAMAAWGRWRRELPGLGRGLKRGFTFYLHRPGEAYANGAENENRLLVAASPTDESADLHWLRSDVDAALAQRAAEAGVVLFEECPVEGVELRGKVVGLATGGGRGPARLDAARVVDASGPSGVVARSLGAVDHPGATLSRLDFAHIAGLPTLAESAPSARFDAPPYPEEAAAVHHLLDEGWIYVLRFDDGVASVGLVSDPPEPTGSSGASAEGAFASVVDRYPSLGAAFSRSRAVRAWRRVGALGHRLDRAAGERWFALPHTLWFADPMFSIGIAWSLHAVERLIEVLCGDADGERYAADLSRDADRLADLVLAARRARTSFRAFVAVTWVYFVAASWLETVQRLDPRRSREGGFLGTGDEVLDPLPGAVLGRVERARQAGFEPTGVEALRRWAARALEPRDLIGISEASARNLHPVSFERLVERSSRLGIDPESLRARQALFRD